jgi:uncharacterized SAM-binding protein YcdF (DUF218 family)
MNLVATRWWSMLFMPSCVLMAGIAVGLAWCLWSWRRGKAPRQAWPAVALAAGSAFLLYLASTPLVARWAAWTLEREVPAIAVERLPMADAIVVLGGSMYATQREDGSVHLYAKHGSDRFDTALAAFRAGRAPLMVFGGGGTGVEGTPSEGEWNRGRAVERGVPEGAALAADRAQYTSDESQLVAERLRERGAKSLIVCSSAAHLPRAAEHYRRLGFTVTSLPSDFSTRGAAEGWSWALLVPRGIALAQVDGVAKEWMGRVAGALGQLP